MYCVRVLLPILQLLQNNGLHAGAGSLDSGDRVSLGLEIHSPWTGIQWERDGVGTERADARSPAHTDVTSVDGRGEVR